MRIDLKFDGIDSVRATLAKLTGQQAAAAYAAALNDTAFQVQRTMRKEIASVFDRPTPYVINSVYVKKATAERMSVTIEPTYYGGKGIDPQKILQAQEFGGTRRDKRSESALRRAGILPAGHQTVIPRNPYPGSDDGRGNIRGPFLVQILSYVQAFGEQGYRANATDRRKRSIHKGTANTAGRRYFVSYGRLRSGRTSHLAAGIWAASGTQSVDVRPVLLFVRNAVYRSRLSMQAVADKAGLDDYLSRRLRYRIRQAVGE